MNKEFYNIGRGSLNINGKFYYGLDYAITDFMRDMEQEIAKLNQGLNEIREYIKSIENEPDADMYMRLGDYKEFKHILQIIDKVGGNE